MKTIPELYRDNYNQECMEGMLANTLDLLARIPHEDRERAVRNSTHSNTIGTNMKGVKNQYYWAWLRSLMSEAQNLRKAIRKVEPCSVNRIRHHFILKTLIDAGFVVELENGPDDRVWIVGTQSKYAVLDEWRFERVISRGRDSFVVRKYWANENDFGTVYEAVICFGKRFEQHFIGVAKFSDVGYSFEDEKTALAHLEPMMLDAWSKKTGIGVS